MRGICIDLALPALSVGTIVYVLVFMFANYGLCRLDLHRLGGTANETPAPLITAEDAGVAQREGQSIATHHNIMGLNCRRR
jgi:hypothetical protein